MVPGLEGREDSIGKALDRVRRQGAGVQLLDKDVRRDEGRCTQCGACVTICPPGALWKQSDKQEVRFPPHRCIACELCAPACPPRAMEVAL